MKVTTLLSLSLFLSLLMACSRTDQCPADSTYGPYYLTEESKAYLPAFQPGDTLLFRNETAEELTFFTLHPPVAGVEPLYAWYAPCGRGEEEVRVEMKVEFSNLDYFALDNYFLSFSNRVAYLGSGCPPDAEVDENNLYDYLQVNVLQPQHGNLAQHNHSYLGVLTSTRGNRLEQDKGDPIKAFNYEYRPEFRFRGQTHRDVYSNTDETLVFSRNYRLLAFRDQGGEWWWLHRTVSPEETDN